MHKFVDLAKIQVAETILTFFMVFLLPFLRFYGLASRVALPAILGIFLYQRNRPLKLKYRFDRQALTELIRIGFPYSFWGSLYTSVWVATESALVLSLGGVGALGLFSVAVTIRNAMNTLPIAVWEVLLPRVVTNFAREEGVSKMNPKIIWITAALIILMILLAMLGSFALTIVVPYVIPNFIDAIPVMKVCLWFSVVQAAFLPLSTLFAAGKPWLYGRSVIAGIIVFPLTTYLLLPEVGPLLSVAVGSLLGRIARTLAAYVDLILLTRGSDLRLKTNRLS
jgi:hypothetical protein